MDQPSADERILARRFAILSPVHVRGRVGDRTRGRIGDRTRGRIGGVIRAGDLLGQSRDVSPVLPSGPQVQNRFERSGILQVVRRGLGARRRGDRCCCRPQICRRTRWPPASGYSTRRGQRSRSAAAVQQQAFSVAGFAASVAAPPQQTPLSAVPPSACPGLTPKVSESANTV